MNIVDYGAEFFAGLMCGVNTIPGNYYLTLTTEEPEMAGDGTDLSEPVDGSYARKTISNPSDWETLSDGVFSNVDSYSWIATTDWGTVYYVVLVSTSTVATGEVYGYWELDQPVLIEAGNQFFLPIGGISFSVTGPDQIFLD